MSREKKQSQANYIAAEPMIVNEARSYAKHAAGMDFTGWGALAPIAIYNQFVKRESANRRNRR